MSQLSLDDYHGAEEVFTNELTKYTKKQFFEVSRNFVVLLKGHKCGVEFAVVSDDDITLLQVEG